MCDVCKLDKASICDYNCIKRRPDFMFRFFTCPKFIYDDKEPITNAELLSTDIKNDVDAAATQLWDKLITKKILEPVRSLQNGLKSRLLVADFYTKMYVLCRRKTREKTKQCLKTINYKKCNEISYQLNIFQKLKEINEYQININKENTIEQKKIFNDIYSTSFNDRSYFWMFKWSDRRY